MTPPQHNCLRFTLPLILTNSLFWTYCRVPPPRWLYKEGRTFIFTSISQQWLPQTTLFQIPRLFADKNSISLKKSYRRINHRVRTPYRTQNIMRPFLGHSSEHLKIPSYRWGSECWAHHIFSPRSYGNLATAKVLDCLPCSSPIGAKILPSQLFTNKDDPVII